MGKIFFGEDFYVIKEVDIIENSCVLFGANSLTPTLAIKSDTLKITKDFILKTIDTIKKTVPTNNIILTTSLLSSTTDLDFEDILED